MTVLKRYRSHIINKRASIISTLACILLLTVQFGALIHSVDHPFHAPSQSCQPFSTMEHAKNGMVSCTIQLPVPRVRADMSVALYTPAQVRLRSSHTTRAPPLQS